jgi:chromosome segregation ATPase
MKLQIASRLTLPFALTLTGPAGLLISGGCQTRGYEKAAATSDAITSAANQVELAKTQIGETMTALQTLANQPATELKPAFERYRTSVASLDKTVAQLKQQTDEMEKQGRSYFNTWDTRLSEIHSEDIRARSAERQREVTVQFTDLQHSYQDTRLQLEPLMSTLRDIQASLGVDLTPAGVQSAREFISRADTHANSARQALDQLGERLRNLSTTLNPNAGPAPIKTSP